jgi:hypothetical protein
MRYDHLLECWDDHPRLVAQVLIALFRTAARRLREMTPKMVQLLAMQYEHKEQSERQSETQSRRIEIARRMLAQKQPSE